MTFAIAVKDLILIRLVLFTKNSEKYVELPLIFWPEVFT